MPDLGFAKELNAIFAASPRRRQTLLFSATFPTPSAAWPAASWPTRR